MRSLPASKIALLLAGATGLLCLSSAGDAQATVPLPARLKSTGGASIVKF